MLKDCYKKIKKKWLREYSSHSTKRKHLIYYNNKISIKIRILTIYFMIICLIHISLKVELVNKVFNNYNKI